jgi:hypothetical protein
LWANDLSSFDSIYKLPFHIPFMEIILVVSDFGIDTNFLLYENDNWCQQMAAPTARRNARYGKNDERFMYHR